MDAPVSIKDVFQSMFIDQTANSHSFARRLTLNGKNPKQNRIYITAGKCWQNTWELGVMM